VDLKTSTELVLLEADFALSTILFMHGEQKSNDETSANAIVEEVLHLCLMPPLICFDYLDLGKERAARGNEENS